MTKVSRSGYAIMKREVGLLINGVHFNGKYKHYGHSYTLIRAYGNGWLQLLNKRKMVRVRRDMTLCTYKNKIGYSFYTVVHF